MGKMTIPLLSLRDVVVFPHMLIPLFVGRGKSILALEAAMESSNKQILLVTQKDSQHNDPEASDLYSVGTIANVLQLLKLPDNTVKVLVEGVARGRIISYHPEDKFLQVDIMPMQTTADIHGEEKEALIRSIFAQFEQLSKLSSKVSPELISSIVTIDDLERLVDAIAAQIPLKIYDKQKILGVENLRERIRCFMEILELEIDLLHIQVKIRGDVKLKMEDDHRKYYLTEQKKAIEKQLTEITGMASVGEPEELEKKILQAGMPQEAAEKAMAELNKLKAAPMGAEATQSRNYIDWMVKLPWKNSVAAEISLESAEQILDTEHHGLEKVKERILEYLAVQKRVKKVSGSVLCLVGPPGVGKTSLGRSIAHATKREYVRIALGGLRDEAEIRGHRKTYVGSMPGKILQKLAKVGVNNPLILLDEVDKMAMDYRGDPASALLEVLDSEQNHSFNDHYLEVDYDLSNVMFVCTSNSLNIPAPLLDRMEVIRISGYTEEEKLSIANQHLITKQKTLAGLETAELSIPDAVIIDIIRYYTRESGVRNLEREIAKICRKIVKRIQVNSAISSYILSSNNLEEYLGGRKFRFGIVSDKDQIGEVTGLAWTEVGGEILTIEAMVMPGKGTILKTGKLGDVMQESIQAAMTVVRSLAEELGIDVKFYENKDIHIHVPEGATPKDGPSAGIAMCSALVSVLTNTPIRKEFAMTGEITLSGQVLPIGGLKEKLLAAKRAGITQVIIPQENLAELKEIPDNIYDKLNIHPVSHIKEVLKLCLARNSGI